MNTYFATPFHIPDTVPGTRTRPDARIESGNETVIRMRRGIYCARRGPRAAVLQVRMRESHVLLDKPTMGKK